MATPKVLVSEAADDDLLRLDIWISNESGAKRADAVLQRISESMLLLATMPRMGRIRRDLDGAPHAFVVAPWIILYQPLTDEVGISILRVLDGRRDLPAQRLR